MGSVWISIPDGYHARKASRSHDHLTVGLAGQPVCEGRCELHQSGFDCQVGEFPNVCLTVGVRHVRSKGRQV